MFKLATMPCAFLWYPLTLWLAKVVCMHPVLGSMQVSNLRTVIANVGYAILLSVVQSCAKVLRHTPSRCLKKLMFPRIGGYCEGN